MVHRTHLLQKYYKSSIARLFFEVPSNLLMRRVGARVWIARIMLTWAVISAASLFVTTPAQFYIVRFLLGVAEAGFFPASCCI